VRSTLPYDDPHDSVATSRAFLIIPSVHSWFVHPPVNHTITEIAPELLNRLEEGFLYRFVKFNYVLLRQGRGYGERMNFNLPQNLIYVDVSKSGDDGLIE
jgi:hypothetical protein